MKYIIKMKKQLNKHGQIIALTGGIGAGKSYILNCFKLLGFLTYSFDQIIGYMYKKGSKGYDIVAAIFPDCATLTHIDKSLLAKRVFSNKDELKKLEEAIHPIVWEHFHNFMEKIKKQSRKSVVVEIPLLFESTHRYEFDVIISAIVDKEIQKNRVLQRKNMTIDKFNAIEQRQTTDDYRIKNSDFIINTSISTAHTFKQIKIILYGKYKRSSIRY